MSFPWNYNNAHTMNPGSTDHSPDHPNSTERLLAEFHTQLMDHKKKQSNLIQNFLSSNSKFDQVTQHFMSQMNPMFKATSDAYRQENQMLTEQINDLRTQIASYRAEMERVTKEKQQIALQIINFCESDINPLEFELFVGALFASLGYRIEHHGKTHDGGIDLIVRHPLEGKGVVQVKQYRNNTKVTEPQIRDLFGAMSAKQEVEYAIMVVLSDCTKEAKTWPNRENVTNLKIWTQRELVALLQEKPITVLIEFVKLLMDKHQQELNGMIQNATHYMTPRTVLKSRHSSRQQIHSSSTLSSAKKQKRNKSVWTNYKFTGVNAEEKEANQETCEDHNDANNNNNNNNNNSSQSLQSGEPSPHSSNDSSLFIDECQSDNDENTNNVNTRRKRKHKTKNRTIQNDLSRINNVFDSTSLLWSINKNNMNKPRRPRRKWTDGDNMVMLNAIKQFGVNWNETGDQWNKIFEECKFSQQFNLMDVKKHYARVLKPKLLSHNLSRSNH